MEENKKKVSLQAKTAFGVILLGVLVGAVACLIGFNTYKKTMTEQINGYVQSVAATAGDMVTDSSMEEMPIRMPGDPVYEENLARLKKIRENSMLSYLMVFKEQDGEVISLYDVDEEILSGEPFHMEEQVDSEENYKRLRNNEIVSTEFDSKIYGWNLTVAVPVLNGAGKQLCVVTASVSMDSVTQMQRAFFLQLAIAIAFVTAILTALAVRFTKKRITEPVSKVTEAAVAFATSDSISEEQVNSLKAVRTGDEVEDLCHSIADMKQEIIDYAERIRAEAAEKEKALAEMNVARQIQAGMLPMDFPKDEKLELFASMCPAKNVGGDFYDFYYLDPDHLVLTIADVSGKGITGALFMAISKAILKNAMISEKSPEKALELANNQLMDSNPMGMFVTVWIALLEISTGKLIASNAGHELPSVKHADGSFELFEDKHGIVLAAMEGMRYKTYEMNLLPGDRLFVYTDGVPEATNAKEELYGTERMLKALNNEKEAAPEELTVALRKDIDLFVGEAPQFDDITMLILNYYGLQS